MSKFNIKIADIETSIRQHKDATVNFEGGLAFTQSPELRLYRMACTSMMGEAKFYQTAKEHDDVFIETVNEVEDGMFLLKLARYVRNEMYLRSVPVVLLAEAAAKKTLKANNGDQSKVRLYTPQILKRVDDCTELLAYWLGKYGKPIPNALKRGIADTLVQFDAYQLGKYRAENQKVTLADTIRLCARNLIEDGNVFHQIVEGKLRSEGTWERTLSEKGNTKESWESILPRMGLMAVLRNLRNMLQANVDLETITARFTDKAILSSKQLPFRWFSAWRAIQNVLLAEASEVMDILNHAMDVSCKNIKPLDGTTAIFIDHSGSMDTPLSKRVTDRYVTSRVSVTTYFETGAILGAIAHQACEKSIVGLFGAQYQTVNLAKSSGVLSNIDKLKSVDVGHSTEAWKAVNWLYAQSIKVDRIIILTDMQVYNRQGNEQYSLYGELIKYRRTYPTVRTYILDMSGYATSAVPEDDMNVIQLAGWSDKIFDFVHAIERDPQEVLRMINES